MTRRAVCTILSVIAAATLVAPSPAGAGRGLSTGIADGANFSSLATSDVWFERTVTAGASFIVVGGSWSGIAPVPVSGPLATDPGNPSYRWNELDGVVRAASARRLRLVLNLAYAPAWAEGSGRPRSAAAGSWRPDASAFGAFVRAAARRYAGNYPDPLSPGRALPAVSYWQMWGEPNLSGHLAPQYVRRRGRSIAESPQIYRALLNAGYDAVKSVRRSNVVLTGGTAPFGGSVGANVRVPPAQFVRELLCLGGHRLRPQRCPQPARFDVLAHDPYSVGDPHRRALATDDVTVPISASSRVPSAPRSARAVSSRTPTSASG